MIETCRALAKEPEAFPRVHSTLQWMDELAGNQGLAERSPLALRKGLFDDPPLIENDRREFNQFRRRLLRARTIADMSVRDRQTLEDWSAEFDAERDEWVERAERSQRVIRGDVTVPPSELRPEDADIPPERVVADRLIDILLGDRRIANEYKPRPHSEIRSRLREFLHYHAGQIAKAGNKAPYNFRKHRSDYVDSMLLTFCAADYTVVTRDQGILGTLVLGKCPEPRVIAIGAMLEKLAPASDT